MYNRGIKVYRDPEPKGTFAKNHPIVIEGFGVEGQKFGLNLYEAKLLIFSLMAQVPEFRHKLTQVQILSRTVYDGNGRAFDNSDFIDKYEVGDFFVSEAAAPGYGRTVYLVTKNNDKGLWGIEVENTVQVLSPDQVR